ncbi:MAG: phytanoyl-CoA dioxygenase family protein [Gammaproteobacteria bacterium]
MQQEDSAASEGFNQWTVPWATPEGPEIDAIRAGTFRVEDFEISAEQIADYQRDGVLLLEQAFTDWVEPLRAGLARNLADPQSYRFPAESTRDGEPGRFFDSYCNWTLIPEYRDFVFNSGAAALAGRAMRASYAQFFHEHVFMKEPGTRRATPWHQDIPYYCLSGDQSASIYIALDDVDADLAVQYVKGSHRWGKIYYPKVWLNNTDFNVGDDGYDGAVPDIDRHPQDHDVACWPLRAGDTVLFSFKTLHGTSDGVMRQARSAFSTRWMGDDIRYLERAGETSPPFVDMGLETGDHMREDWFPVLWRKEQGNSL